MKSDQPNYSERITKMIADAEQAAYIRGWEECFATIVSAAELKNPRSEAKKGPFGPAIVAKKARGKKRKAARRHVLKNEGPSQARAIVLEAIKQNPRRTGTQIAEIVAKDVNKHTVRTQLRKLRLAEEIFQDTQLRWYVPELFREAS
jgi:predicted HTH transcriptional regulator